MGPSPRLRSILALIAVLTSSALRAGPARPAAAPTSHLVRALETELARSLSGLREQPVKPYFISYSVYETDRHRLSASFGAVTDRAHNRQRLLVVDLRVGDYAFDNTHQVRGEDGDYFQSTSSTVVSLPLEDEPLALAAAVWRATDQSYREAVEALARVTSNRAVMVTEEDQSADWSRLEPTVLFEPAPAAVAFAADPWLERLRRYSAVFALDPNILDNDVTVEVARSTRTIVSSEGTRLTTHAATARLAMSAAVKADDGMELPRYESFFAFEPADLPGDEIVLPVARKMVDDLGRLRSAPTMEPYTGPAILSGRSAGVFFHEIFGHRIEGQRQKDEQDGQTFKKLIGQEVLPPFLSVSFDPTRRQIGATAAAGYYRFDDQGAKAAPVTVVEAGILKAFLMSRAPIEGFPSSNGHGRAQAGNAPVARQSNLLVEASTAVSTDCLRALLLDEVRAQKKDFGLLFSDIAGGFTFTGRETPNAFSVQPLMVWRVFADGRPDELVRGADLIGTPLTSFSKILAAADDTETFNGVCGAESGWVPVSASSPSLLLAQIEVQKKEKSSARSPILPAPKAAIATAPEPGGAQ